jgi:predicted RNA binding protein YcfA (HicA-like mRNA interferase family)
MTRIDKKIEKFLNDPCSIKYPDLENILIYFGFAKINAKGSHVKFKHHKLKFDLIIPVHGGECKDFYKREAKKQIKKIKQ